MNTNFQFYRVLSPKHVENFWSVNGRFSGAPLGQRRRKYHRQPAGRSVPKSARTVQQIQHQRAAGGRQKVSGIAHPHAKPTERRLEPGGRKSQKRVVQLFDGAGTQKANRQIFENRFRQKLDNFF